MPSEAADLAWLVRGRQRRIVFSSLPARFLPNQLRKDLKGAKTMAISLREMSRHLRDFEARGLVRCINPSDPYGRIYEVTTKGKHWQDSLQTSGL